ncbi:MAG: glycosyltransferase family 4 protein [Elusimicrobiota bacterium]|nr:glycosyltransferase family 4 protein [Elusimicrobiota bacterium]
MKVLQIYCSYSCGGGEIATIELSKWQKNIGIDVILCCPKNSFLYIKSTESNIQTETINIIGSLDIYGILKLLHIVKKHNIEVLHLHQGKILWPAAIIKKFFIPTLKIILHRRTMTPIKKISFWTLKYLNAIIADSNAVKSVLIEKSNVNAKKIFVIYPSIDLKKYQPIDTAIARKKLGIPEESFVIGTVAAMIPPVGKGQEYLIRATKKIYDKKINIHCVIVGDGDMLPYFKRLTKNLDISERVLFAGYQKDVNEFISAMDVFCLLSTGGESFGMVLIEAQAMHKPVIGTTVGGIPETISEGKTGFLIPPGDTDRLTELLLELSSNKSKYDYLLNNTRRWVEQNFNIEHMIEKIMQLYISV